MGRDLDKTGDASFEAAAGVIVFGQNFDVSDGLPRQELSLYHAKSGPKYKLRGAILEPSLHSCSFEKVNQVCGTKRLRACLAQRRGCLEQNIMSASGWH